MRLSARPNGGRLLCRRMLWPLQRAATALQNPARRRRYGSRSGECAAAQDTEEKTRFGDTAPGKPPACRSHRWKGQGSAENRYCRKTAILRLVKISLGIVYMGRDGKNQMKDKDKGGPGNGGPASAARRRLRIVRGGLRGKDAPYAHTQTRETAKRLPGIRLF